MMTKGITEIRPRIVFELVEDKFQNVPQKFLVNIPPSQIGGLLLLESAILVSLMRVIDAKEVFEFGTFMGATSVLLAENSPEKTHITTLDIDPESFAASDTSLANLRDADENDEFLRNEFYSKGPKYINHASEDVKKKITQVHLDSRTVVPEKQGLQDRFDLIFIDGGHDYETIKNDTEKALVMGKEDSVILWHDFRSTIHTNVTDYLDEFSESHHVIHVQNTMLAIHCKGKHARLFERV
ncbi:MAG: class I SAM-dependent methyltransferase [Anaerolineae bacterium]|nr:class I SAM-dependent methyltransferase [Anaerolineae bacterium]